MALLAEDVAGVRGVIADALEQAGFHVLRAASAEEALALCQGEREPPLCS